MKNKLLKLFITILFISLPISDILRNSSFINLEFLGISILELLNVILLGGSFIITLTKIHKKKMIFLVIYAVLLCLYLVFHYQNISNFDTSIVHIQNYSFLKETIYLLRIYFLPLLAIPILIWNRDVFDKTFYSHIIKYLIAFISFSIIILDFLNLSYPSYDDIVDLKYAPSIFHYLNYNGDPQDLLAKGWFESANEISVILFALLPINIYLLYKEGKISNVIIFISHLFSMIILGTRTSAYGSVIIPYFCLSIYIFFILIKKEKVRLPFLCKLSIPLLCISFVFIYSPFRQFKRQIDPELLGTNNTDKISMLLNGLNSDTEKIDVIKKHLYDFGIESKIEELYPINNDLDFWLEICHRDLRLNNNYRVIKHEIIKRIKQRNNNKYDNLFGMHFLLNYMNMERDYVQQYYELGLFGTILLVGVYFIIFLYTIIQFFKNFKEKFKFEYILLFMAMSFGLIVPYLSGHTFGAFFPMFVLSLLISLLHYMVGDKLED